MVRQNLCLMAQFFWVRQPHLTFLAGSFCD